jgi:hypothetical protein
MQEMLPLALEVLLEVIPMNLSLAENWLKSLQVCGLQVNLASQI